MQHYTPIQLVLEFLLLCIIGPAIVSQVLTNIRLSYHIMQSRQHRGERINFELWLLGYVQCSAEQVMDVFLLAMCTMVWWERAAYGTDSCQNLEQEPWETEMFVILVIELGHLLF